VRRVGLVQGIVVAGEIGAGVESLVIGFAEVTDALRPTEAILVAYP
jgi:hypothetical protein